MFFLFVLLLFFCNTSFRIQSTYLQAPFHNKSKNISGNAFSRQTIPFEWRHLATPIPQAYISQSPSISQQKYLNLLPTIKELHSLKNEKIKRELYATFKRYHRVLNKIVLNILDDNLLDTYAQLSLLSDEDTLYMKASAVKKLREIFQLYINRLCAEIYQEQESFKIFYSNKNKNNVAQLYIDFIRDAFGSDIARKIRSELVNNGYSIFHNSLSL